MALLKKVAGDLSAPADTRGADLSFREDATVIGVEREQRHAAGTVVWGEHLLIHNGGGGWVVCDLCEGHCVCKSKAVISDRGHVDFDGGLEASSVNDEVLAETGCE